MKEQGIKPEPSRPEQQKQKEWYQNWWGVILAILFLPFFGIWYAWAKSNWSKGVKITVTVVASFFILSAIANPPAQTTNSGNNQPKQESPKQEAQKEPEDPNPHFKDGTLVVGKDIQPGTYRTRKGSSGCYYARLSGFSGELSEILSNENTDYPAVVTIAAGDKGFKSSRCGTWTQDVSAITTSQTSFDDGIYIVGTDIQPGTYRSSGQSGCYYSRLSNFTGELSGIISNDNTDTAAVVAIAATDKGFKSSRCGTWTKS